MQKSKVSKKGSISGIYPESSHNLSCIIADLHSGITSLMEKEAKPENKEGLSQKLMSVSIKSSVLTSKSGFLCLFFSEALKEIHFYL